MRKSADVSLVTVNLTARATLLLDELGSEMFWRPVTETVTPLLVAHGAGVHDEELAAVVGVVDPPIDAFQSMGVFPESQMSLPPLLSLKLKVPLDFPEPSSVPATFTSSEVLPESCEVVSDEKDIPLRGMVELTT